MLRLRVAAFLLLTLTAACSTSPLGRKQLILLPDSQMDLLGSQSFADLKQGQPVSKDARINAYVQCVSKPLLAVSGSAIAAERWEIVVFQEDSANAFALPGGKIGVHTGLLKVAVTPAQLAAVMGHEIGHVLARHGNERVSEGLLAQGGLAVLGQVMKTQGGRQEIAALLGVGLQVGVLLPHSRTQESEADRIGLEMMARAGFDPAQSVELWKNMSKGAGSGQPPEFLSTHPSHSSRIEDLRVRQEKVRPLYLQALEAGKQPRCTPPG
ncbi:MAG: M48 family metallopeptidase [Oligoflexia bacterium]